ncbi:acetylornithine deacetylase [Burkholderia sp. SG-MS1]|uniref:acetylornithine deacetylase n=1 Tax=Paraburkholderia sp. SG-MS1 TaxID=2023741 RepID=UPI001444B630|nr:acetylornithine deacetylase [Paraburkholderia sp. SG-MS1]NKJ45633.1 acetylornithine deacetylase [Paraburkholderia sp. SG-MS1]
MNDHALLTSSLELLEALVEFDTTSRNSNLELIEFVQNYLQQFGIASSLTFDETGNKANLYATIGPCDRGGLCFSGHTDVVPADGQPWTVPPFALTRRPGRVLGRGTADMKGFIAAVLASVPAFVDIAQEVPIHLAFSYDEEVGCKGVHGLLSELNRSPFKPHACVIGEPTHMRVAVAHKGKLAYRCCVKGLAGHSALTHLGVNAADFAAEIAVFLRRTATAIRNDGKQDTRFIPPYSTVHTGRLQGGIALNVIPDHAELDFEIRNLPGENVDAIVEAVRRHAHSTLEPEMQTVSRDTSIVFTELLAYPALRDMSDENPRAAWLKQIAKRLLGLESENTLSFGTEGGLFQNIGIPTIVCGPGSITDAHKADEYIEVDQLAQCLEFIGKLAAAVQTSSPDFLTGRPLAE